MAAPPLPKYVLLYPATPAAVESAFKGGHILAAVPREVVSVSSLAAAYPGYKVLTPSDPLRARICRRFYETMKDGVPPATGLFNSREEKEDLARLRTVLVSTFADDALRAVRRK
jgi:hypothetical protein